jgi:hypothetical protein
VSALALAGTDIFVGGGFTNIGGQSRNFVAKLSTTGTGAADATWNPNANGNVTALVSNGADVYAGGNFTSFGGQTRNRVAGTAVTGNGNASAWNPNADNAVNALLIVGSGLQVAGNFTTIAGQEVPRFAVLTTVATIITTGTPTAMSTTYGTASTPTNFSVSGSNMNAGITVTPPAAFEVSLSAGSGYTNSLVVGSGGNIPATTIYVRLKATTAAGSYSGNIVLSSTGASNVNVAIPSSTVSPKELTITGITANNKEYDGTTTATLSGTPSLVGVIGGDNVSVSGTPVANFNTPDVGVNKPVTVTGYSITGSSVANYTLTQPTGLTANITAKNLTITGITANNKEYDGTTTATLSGTPSLVGVIGGDNVVLSGTPVANFNTPDVGVNKPVTVTGYSITGSSSANYTLTQPTGITANITAKNLTITGITANNKEYDGTTTATLSGTPSLVGVIGGDNVVLSGTPVANFNTPDVGVNKPVTVTGYSITGSSAANYTLTQPAGLTANITQASQTITFNPLPSKNLGDPPFTLTATASSGLPVSYTSSNPAVATVAGNVVTIVGIGSTTITASQAGNVNYAAASPVNQVLVVCNAQITTSSLPNGDLGATYNQTIQQTGLSTPTWSVSSGALPNGITLNAGTGVLSGTFTLAGTYNFSIRASEGICSVERSYTIVVASAQQMVTGVSLPSNQVGTSFTLPPTSNVGLPVIYISSNTSVLQVQGNLARIVGAGTADLIATNNGNANYEPLNQIVMRLDVPIVNSLSADWAEQIQITPNPTSGYFTLKIPFAYAGYKIYNSQGVLMQAGEKGENIDISQFASGVYLIEIQTQWGKARKKLVRL